MLLEMEQRKDGFEDGRAFYRSRTSVTTSRFKLPLSHHFSRRYAFLVLPSPHRLA
jgi:hypothetical protein